MKEMKSMMTVKSNVKKIHNFENPHKNNIFYLNAASYIRK